MNRADRLGLAIAACILAHAATAVVATDGVDAMLREGRYRDAYEASRREAEGAGLRETARALLATSMDSSDSYTRWYALRAAQIVDEPALIEAARRAFAKGDRYDRSLALDLLTKLDPAGSREELTQALESPHRSLRLRAVKGLTRFKDPALAPRFAEILAHDSDPDLRIFAVRALAETGSPEAPAALYGALEDNVGAVCEEVVQALVALRSPGLIEVVRRILAEAPPEKRARAIRMAGLTRNPGLIEDLGPHLADGDPEVRAVAAAAILATSEHAALH